MPDRIPDALMMPESVKRGDRLADRVASLAAFAEPLLGVDRSKGQRAWFHRQELGRLFVTRDPLDTLQFGRDHPDKAGASRYEWEPAPSLANVTLGWLVPDAAR